MSSDKNLRNDIKRIYISKSKLSRTVRRLARQINRDYAGKNLMLLSVLKGSVVFLTDLMREIKLPCRIDFMVVSSYGSGTVHSGTEIKYDLQTDIKDYDVLIVEDILDSGNTLFNLKQMLLAREPRSLKICTLLDKPSRREADITADYTGITIENEFVVGYGLDYDEKYRNLPYIGIPKDSCIKNN